MAVKGLRPSCLRRGTGRDRDPRRSGGGGRGTGEEGDCTQRYTVTSGMTPALRWGAMGASLMFRSLNCEGQRHKTGSIKHKAVKREEIAEAESNRGPSAQQPNPLQRGQA